jgi:hypothetical protein
MRRQLRRLTECRHHEKSAVRVVTRRLIDIESLADFDAHIGKTRRLSGWFVQSVDLTDRADALLGVDPRGAVFLGCVFTSTVEDHLRKSGALLFPGLPDLPFDPYRGCPYDAVELYGAGDYASSLDAQGHGLDGRDAFEHEGNGQHDVCNHVVRRFLWLNQLVHPMPDRYDGPLTLLAGCQVPPRQFTDRSVTLFGSHREPRTGSNKRGSFDEDCSRNRGRNTRAWRGHRRGEHRVRRHHTHAKSDEHAQ